MRNASRLIALTGSLALGACAANLPTGPRVLAMPPAGKDLAAFQQDDLSCRNYAQSTLGPNTPASAAAGSGLATAAVGTALGAAAGALIGSAAGAVGGGAAIGAGAGLLLGSAAGAGNAQAAGRSVQAYYDNAYSQCMVSRGDTIQAPPYPVAYYGYPYRYRGYYPYYAAPYW